MTSCLSNLNCIWHNIKICNAVVFVFLQKDQGRKSSSNPTSPVSQPRRAVSSPEELAMQEAIDAGFVIAGRTQNEFGNGSEPTYASTTGRCQGRYALERVQDAADLYADVAAIATGPRIHRQPRQITHVQSAFADHPSSAEGRGSRCQGGGASENIYSTV